MIVKLNMLYIYAVDAYATKKHIRSSRRAMKAQDATLLFYSLSSLSDRPTNLSTSQPTDQQIDQQKDVR